jgi:uncharacterized protein
MLKDALLERWDASASASASASACRVMAWGVLGVALFTAAGVHAQAASGAASAASAPASVAGQVVLSKKEQIKKLLELQRPGYEGIAKGLIEQPAVPFLQAAARTIQAQVPADKHDAIRKTVDVRIRRYVDEAYPLLRDRALQLAPKVVGAVLEEKFTSDELQQVINWYESPVNKKYLRYTSEIQPEFVQKLVADGRTLIDPKLQGLEKDVREIIRAASQPASGAAPAASAGLKTMPAASAASR